MTIDSFSGEFAFLSNFWLETVDGYASVEHGYQAKKMLHAADAKLVQACRTPGSAKRLARSLPMRKDWEEVKVEIMFDLVTKKFEAPELRIKLLATDNEILIEGNSWNDTFWGVCRGRGKNMLGEILMLVRKHARG